jgi:hypothetical protein
MLARNEHDDVIGRVGELRPISLRAERVDVLGGEAGQRDGQVEP